MQQICGAMWPPNSTTVLWGRAIAGPERVPDRVPDRVTRIRYGVVIAAPDRVRGFSTRNPWIPERVRDDSQMHRVIAAPTRNPWIPAFAGMTSLS